MEKLTSGDMPAMIFLNAIKGLKRRRVIPAVTEFSITTVAPGRAYRASMLMASCRYVVLIPLVGSNDVGTTIKK
jgi:hypothetical protein